MSIYDFYNKIKGLGVVRSGTLGVCLIVTILSVGSFFLGRASITPQDHIIYKDVNIGREVGTEVTASAASAPAVARDESLKPAIAVIEPAAAKGGYVASKNGKLYYRVGCGASKRIKPANLVTFATGKDAEFQGFKPSASCTP